MSTSIDKLCEILKACYEGKTIEYEHEGSWFATDLGCWKIRELSASNFRIKPEPLEIWVGYRAEGTRGVIPTNLFSSEGDAKEYSDLVAKFESIVRFREVLEDE